MNTGLLSIKNLSISLREGDGRLILDDVSLTIGPNMVLGVVGGSGSGKTTLGLALLRLLPPAMQVLSGEILFEGQDLRRLSDEKIRDVRGRRMSMIFQEASSAFDPVYTVGFQIMETLLAHDAVGRQKAQAKMLELLDLVGVDDPRRIAASYPHELSGGLCQRAMIAQAISCGPSLLIADEPTSNLDVTLQARIMDLFRRLRKDLGISIILITHDLGMVRHLADEVVILHQGAIIERGRADKIMAAAKEPYTRELMAAERL